MLLETGEQAMWSQTKNTEQISAKPKTNKTHKVTEMTEVCDEYIQSNAHTCEIYIKYYSLRGGEFFYERNQIDTDFFDLVCVFMFAFSLHFTAMFRQFQIRIISLFSKR